MAYRKYTEDEKLSILAIALAMGFPTKPNTTKKIYEKLKIDYRTVLRFSKTVDMEKLEVKILELKELIDKELDSVFEEMKSKREKATYKDLTIAFGILADKKILLDGGATNRTESISTSWEDLVKAARETDIPPHAPKKKPFKPEMEYKNELES